MTAISSLNTGLTLPADVSGFTLPTGALIPFTDPTDTQEASVGTTKAAPVLRILDHTVSIQGGFNATTSTPNLLNSTGSSGNFYHVTVSGEHNLGDGTEFFAAGWDLLHNGTSYVKYYNIKNFIELNEGLTSPADTYGFVVGSGDLFPLTDVSDIEFNPSGTQKSTSFRNLSENILQYGLATINEQRTSPGDAVGYIPDASDIILVLDVDDTQYSSSGTVKGLPVGSLPSGNSSSGVELALFNPQTDTPNLTNAAGAIGDMFHVTSTGKHDFGNGEEFLSSGWFVLHDGNQFQKMRVLDDSIKTVSLVSDLDTNLVANTHGGLLYAKDRSIAGSGGGGLFKLDTSTFFGANAEDSGLIFAAPTGVNWYWCRELDYNGSITPQMYDALVDGTRDNTPAINAAILAMNSGALRTSIGELFFPVGNYSVTTINLFGGQRLRGASTFENSPGPGNSTRLIHANGATGPLFQKRPEVRINHIEISDMYLEGNLDTSNTDTYGLDFTGISYSYFKNVDIRKFSVAGLYSSGNFLDSDIGQSTNNTFTHCRFHSNVDGMLMEDSVSNIINVFFSCEFASNTSHGIRMLQASNFHFYGCTIQGNNVRSIYFDDVNNCMLEAYVEQDNTVFAGHGIVLDTKSKNNHITVRSTFELMSTFIDSGVSNTLSVRGEGNGIQYYDDPYFHQWIGALPYNFTASQQLTFGSVLDDDGYAITVKNTTSAFGGFTFELNKHFDELEDRWVTVVLDMDTTQFTGTFISPGNTNMRVYTALLTERIGGNLALAPFPKPVDLQGRWFADVKFRSEDNGVHDGSNNDSQLIDSGESFTVNKFVGRRIRNEKDESFGFITANSTTGVTATLSGGTDNDWDIGDTYIIDPTGMINGTHDGANNSAILSDSTLPPFVSGDLVGRKVVNRTDSSYSIITANTTGTVTAALTGSKDGDWDAGDLYTIYPLGKIQFWPAWNATTAGGNVIKIHSMHIVDGQTRYIGNDPGRIQFEPIVVTSAALSGVGSGINIHRKQQGKTVYNSTDSNMYFAKGSGTTDGWAIVTSGTNIVPV